MSYGTTFLAKSSCCRCSFLLHHSRHMLLTKHCLRPHGPVWDYVENPNAVTLGDFHFYLILFLIYSCVYTVFGPPPPTPDFRFYYALSLGVNCECVGL
jgi:hypothetical protein